MEEARFAYSDYHAGEGQLCFGGVTGTPRPVDLTLVYGPGHLEFHQLHEDAVHSATGHERQCELYSSKDIRFDEETETNDAFNRQYAAYLTANTHLVVEYKVHAECGFFHGSKNLFEGMRGRDEFVLQPEWLDDDRATFSEDELLYMLLSERIGGFVAIEGGHETVADSAARATGFCLQRSAPSPEELGPRALESLEAHAPSSVEDPKAWARRELEKKCKSEVTLLRKSYSGINYLSARHFCWLVRHRGLAGYRLRMVVHYEMRRYLADFVQSCLQDRHDLALEGKKGGVESMVLKLFLNR